MLLGRASYLRLARRGVLQLQALPQCQNRFQNYVSRSLGADELSIESTADEISTEPSHVRTRSSRPKKQRAITQATEVQALDVSKTPGAAIDDDDLSVTKQVPVNPRKIIPSKLTRRVKTATGTEPTPIRVEGLPRMVRVQEGSLFRKLTASDVRRVMSATGTKSTPIRAEILPRMVRVKGGGIFKKFTLWEDTRVVKSATRTESTPIHVEGLPRMVQVQVGRLFRTREDIRRGKTATPTELVRSYVSGLSKESSAGQVTRPMKTAVDTEPARAQVGRSMRKYVSSSLVARRVKTAPPMKPIPVPRGRLSRKLRRRKVTRTVERASNITLVLAKIGSLIRKVVPGKVDRSGMKATDIEPKPMRNLVGPELHAATAPTTGRSKRPKIHTKRSAAIKIRLAKSLRARRRTTPIPDTAIAGADDFAGKFREIRFT